MSTQAMTAPATWLREGLAWRLAFIRRYAFLLRSFRNSRELIHTYRRRLPCDRAVGWNGITIRHPPDRQGLVETILEIWMEQVYTGDFYHPAGGDVVIDAGANIGLFSVWLAGRQPGCRIVAFEPCLENFEFLSANIASAARSNVTGYCAALGETAGFATMDTSARRSLDYRLAAAADGAVRVHTFAEALKMAGADEIALFKIDIEGSEYGLFTSAADADLARVSRFAIEYHDNLRPGTCAFVAERLRATHHVTIRPSPNAEYGMLYAVRQQAV